jgi:hypothetical protein
LTQPSTQGPAPDDENRLNERDAEIHRVLAAEDPDLAGLFLFLLRAMAEVERPGGVHMLGHAGRELSLGVLRYLAADSRPLAEGDENSDRKNEKHRITIGRALRLPPNHPSVTAWLQAHNQLVSFAHYTKARSTQAASQRDALAAANALIALLWSRTGPFFGTKEDIERLLAIEIPTESDIAALHTALSRPAVRWDFFRRLEHPGWVAPLLNAGFFNQPPDLLPLDEDGQQRWEGWSEGEYLRRMADKVPADVRDALATIPETLRNPYVWDGAAEAAKAMPPSIAVTLVPLFRKALANSLPWMLQETLGELAVKLAEAGQSDSFGLARDVLRVVEGKPSIVSMVEGTDRKDAALFGLDDYEAEQLIPKLAAALRLVDADKALKFFIHRLDEALRIEWGEPSQEPTWDPSQHWCPDLSEPHDHHGFKEHLAVTIAQLSSEAAAKSPEDAKRILELLVKQPWRVYRRMRLYVLAQAGKNASEELSSVVRDTELVQEEYPPAEYLRLLAQQFDNASAESRSAVIDAIISGPGTDDEIRRLLTDERGVPDDEGIRKYRVRWQRKRLRRFGNTIPRELTDLATRLDADTSVPKPSGDELELEDKGSTGGFAWTGGPQSPLTSDELDALSPEGLLAYLRDYKPTRERFGAPTPVGLASAIASRIRKDPSFGAAFVRLLPAGDVERTYVRGALEGFVGAAEDSRDIPWREVLPFVEWVAHQSGGDELQRASDFDYADANWRWAQREAAKLISFGATKDLAGASDADALWKAAEALLAADATWSELKELPETMDGALMAALNSIAGESVEAFLDVALWNYRRSQPAKTEADGESSDVPVIPMAFPIDRLRAGVETILARQGSSANAGRVRLGQYLPQLLLLDREWILERAPVLFAGGFAPPLTNPVWGGYITTQRLYNSVFNDLKTWYLEAAKALPADEASILSEKQKDTTWSTTRHLALHCLLAVLRDLATPTDTGGVVSTVFERASIADRSHAYWEMFSGWKGPVGSIPAPMVNRLLEFWSWRLDVLATRGPEERKAEAGALGWLALVNALPEERVLSLLSRTAEQADGLFPMEHSMWERLGVLVDIDVEVTIDIVARIVRAELSGKYPHFNISDVGPVLAAALESDNPAAHQKAKDLVNLLGDRGFTEFGTLL